MSDRDPRKDPMPGDELRGDPWCYRVTKRNERGGITVWFEMWLPRSMRDIGSSHRISLSGWRDMAAGLTVEKVA